MSAISCKVCHRACLLEEGQTGACHARVNEQGVIRPLNYGLQTSLALDPIEKKPLYHFHPRSMILSAGTFGCNLRCPFCQNAEISCARMKRDRVVFRDADGEDMSIPVRRLSPEELTELATMYRGEGNIGLAFTYNEPMVGYEYVRDTARLCHEQGMKTVLVTAGCISLAVLKEVLPHIDAMNIDLKSISASFYSDFVGGDLDMVKTFIETAVSDAATHVELTTLIIPGKNDTEEEMDRLSSWVASLDGGRGRGVPLHVSRFFPRHRMLEAAPTDVGRVYRLAEVARAHLKHVHTGNC